MVMYVWAAEGSEDWSAADCCEEFEEGGFELAGDGSLLATLVEKAHPQQHNRRKSTIRPSESFMAAILP